MDLALNNLQRLICHKTKQTNQTRIKVQELNFQILPFVQFYQILNFKTEAGFYEHPLPCMANIMEYVWFEKAKTTGLGQRELSFNC